MKWLVISECLGVEERFWFRTKREAYAWRNKELKQEYSVKVYRILYIDI